MAYVYTAKTDIRVAAGIYAHRKGDIVPEENVKANGWQDLVTRKGGATPSSEVTAKD